MGPIERELRSCPHHDPYKCWEWFVEAPRLGGCGLAAFGLTNACFWVGPGNAADELSEAIEAAEALGL